jgi:hypothetical protein
MDAAPPDDERTVVRPTGPAGRLGHILPVGTRLRDFEITGLIGEGGFGIVYLADDRSLQRRVALKEYMPSSMAARIAGAITVAVKSERHREAFDAGLRSFVNEARLLARFDHPSLVKVYRFWEEHGTAYMVMPYYEGQTLRAALDARSSPPDEATLRAWLRPLLDALDVMHAAHCYHRDIAPDNILLTSNGPLLLDFGAARRVIGDMTHALTVVLKPGYAPIEQYGEVAALAQGAWTDFYALASVVHFAITGRVPPSSVERLLDDRLERLATCAAGRYSARFLAAIDAALAVRPQDRPQTDAEFRALLDEPRAASHPPGGSFGPVSRPVPLDDAAAARSMPGAALRDNATAVEASGFGEPDGRAPARSDDARAPGTARAPTRPATLQSANASNRKAARVAVLAGALVLIATGAYLRFGRDDDAATAALRHEATTGSSSSTTAPAAPASATAPMTGDAATATSVPMTGGAATATSAPMSGGAVATTAEPMATAPPAPAAAALTSTAPAAPAALAAEETRPAPPSALEAPVTPAPPAGIDRAAATPSRSAAAAESDTRPVALPEPPPAHDPSRRGAATDAPGRAVPGTPALRRAADRADAARRNPRAESAKPAPTSDGATARCGDILQKASLEPLSAAEVSYLKRECR